MNMPQPAFRFLPFRSGLRALLMLPACSFVLFMLAGCKPNAAIQGRGQDYLQGEWQQQPDTIHQHLLTYSLYHFKFSCDSFYVQQQWFSKVNAGPDTCMRSGHWVEYMKGTYQQQKDTLHLKGFFCNANFSLKNETTCFRSGPYDEVFIAAAAGKNLHLQSTSNVLPVHLQLTKRATCKPQPIQP